MKFVLRSGLNAGASLVVSLFTLYMLSFLTSIIIYTNIYDIEKFVEHNNGSAAAWLILCI